MKFIVPFKWAENTNYTADGSGQPWRTGYSPTKVVPPNVFADAGNVPGERYAAQWENYVKNTTAKALRDAQLTQLTGWSKLAAAESTANDSPAWVWNPVAKIWVQLTTTTMYYRDLVGNEIRSKAQAGGSFNLSGSCSNFGFFAISGFGAANTRRIQHQFQGAASGSTTIAQPLIDTPGSGTTLVFQSGNTGKYVPVDTRIYVAGTSGGTWSVLSLTNAGNWTATALPTVPGSGIAGVETNGGWFCNNPLNNDFYLMGSDTSNTTIYRWQSGAPGTWTQIYNGASLFGGAKLHGQPVFDAVNNRWVYIVDASVARATDATRTRFRTSIYTAPANNPQVVTLQKQITGIALSNMKDLGNGVYVATSRRFTGQSTTPLTTVVFGIAVSVDGGMTWNLVGYDFDMSEQTDIGGINDYLYGAQFLLSDDSLIMTYRNISQRTCYTGLVRPGGDLAVYT